MFSIFVVSQYTPSIHEKYFDYLILINLEEPFKQFQNFNMKILLDISSARKNWKKKLTRQ